MKYLKKTGVFLVIFAFIFQSISTPIYAMSSEEQIKTDDLQTATILLDDDLESVPLYEEDIETSEILTLLQSDEEVIVLEKLDDFSLVEYIENGDDEKTFHGFILNDFLNFEENENLEELFDEEEENLEESIDQSESENDSNINESEDENVEDLEDISKGETANEIEDDEGAEVDDVEEVGTNSDEDTEDIIVEKHQTFSVQSASLSQQTLFGVALKTKTNVYKAESTSSGIIRDYAQGSVLKYKTHNPNWYEATVYINGKATTGYIHKNDVENITESQTVLHGISLKNPTKIYSKASTEAGTLRTYAQGSVLKYKTLTSNWYEATVMYNGKWTTGYIHKNDVENVINNQETLSGIGLKNPTKVYSRASTSSNSLKSYSQGSILKYKTFSNNWYEATVFINGKATTGYIHRSDVENSVTNQTQLQGIGTQNPTAVFASASTGSKKLKSYAQGSILTYRTFSNNWYQATVYVNGKATTGYIHKSHVDGIVDKQVTLNGIGLKNPTTVYARASTGSNKLRSYAQGAILKYKTFSSNWYEATVFINGKATTGYIHKNDVEELFDTSQSLDGMSLKSPTNVYSRASKNANVLRSYPKSRYLLFRTLSPNWYEATVMYNGKWTTGYIHSDDVSTDKISIKTTSYSPNFNSVVDIQMTRGPQTSGPNGGWVNATRQQVEYYVNSSNFSKNSTDYYQFLVLNQHADLNVNEVNQKILNNHGTLTGKAQAFIDAGQKHNINEAYLISHALLETGNGRSTLAQGVPVDNKGNVVAESKKSYTVYNMYGIGATDSAPLNGGAKRAFDEGWFTPEEAIIGGAEFINTYITRGQDTLYKMRWNPIAPGHPQYATDVGWAVKQTSNISKIYSLLDQYVLIYDVPKYAGQPSSSGNPEYIPNIEGTHLEVTEPNGLRVRDGAGTSNNIVDTVYKGTKLALALDKNNKIISKVTGGHIWYQIEFEGSIAWISGGENGTEYVKFLK